MSSSSNNSSTTDTQVPDLNKNDLWDVIYSYFQDSDTNRNYYLTNHHLDSYNDFILNKIPQTLKENSPQTIFLGRDSDTKKYKYEIDIYYGGINSDKVYLGKPIIYHKENTKKQMFPNEARLKNLTYSAHVFCDIDVIVRTNEYNNSSNNSNNDDSESSESSIGYYQF